MKILQDIYDLYLQSINKEKESEKMNVDISNRELDILHNAQKQAAPQLELIAKSPIKIGDIYLFEDIFFTISDDNTYPYEAMITSPFWELATHKDIVVDGDEDKWVIESIVRYVDDNILKNSIKVDMINKKYIEIMQKYLNDEEELPQELKGTRYEDEDNSFQMLFRKNEIKRSLFLTMGSIEEMDEDIEEVVEIDLKESNIEESAIKEIEEKLAAFSFDKFITTKFGEMIKIKDGIIINLEDKFAGCLARVSIKNTVIFEGFLPRKFKINTQIKYPKQLEEIINIELL
jgi:hypothetical protein